MASSYSNYITEWHGGRTRAYVEGYIESETSKTATVYVRGCAEGDNLTQYGVRTTVYADGKKVATTTGNIFSPGAVTQVASCGGRLVVEKTSSSRSVSIAATISGETVNGYGPIAGSATVSISVQVGAIVLMPPSAPTGLTAIRNANANIELSWINNASNAASTIVERCKSGSDWEQAFFCDGVVESYVDSPGEGYFKYRVRYGNADGYSGYSNETEYVPMLSPPAAPTLVSPSSGATVNANMANVTLYWRHNSKDTSPQAAARVSWSQDNTTFEVINLESETSCSLPVAQNQTVYWKVATKGAHQDFGPESGVAHFLVRTAPVAILTIPATVYSLPIPVSWVYEDAIGTQASAVVEVLNQEGTVLFSKALLNESSCEITAAELPLERQVPYTVRLTVASTTSLTYATQGIVTVEYQPPAKPCLAVAVNTRRGECFVTVFAGEDDGAPNTAHITLLRDGEMLAEGLNPGTCYLDSTPPLDIQTTYTAVAHTDAGAISKGRETTMVNSGGFVFFNFGDGRVAKLGMNVAISDQTQAEREFYATASSKYPKVFYGEHSERTGSISAEVFWAQDVLGYGEEAMLSSIVALKEHAGPVILRLPRFEAFKADLGVTIERSTAIYNVAAVSVEWRRIE